MRSARNRAELTLREVGIRVAQAIGRREPYTPQNVQQWELGKKVKGGKTIPVDPSNEALHAFALLVGLRDTTWLVSGVEVTQSDAMERVPAQGRVVAMITAEAAIERPINYHSDQHFHTQVSCSKKSFGFTVFDRRNQPEFELGDRIVIDPEAKREPGMMVFAVVGGRPVFACYTEPRVRKDHRICNLQAIDKKWGAVEASSKAGDRIIGVMVEHTKLGPHPRYGS
jgi:SOS-response transcriptional repressor LexA